MVKTDSALGQGAIFHLSGAFVGLWVQPRIALGLFYTHPLHSVLVMRRSGWYWKGIPRPFTVCTILAGEINMTGGQWNAMLCW